MQDETCSFNLSSALTGLSHGRFDKAAFSQVIQPIRARLMELDGMTGCRIERYGVQMQYKPNVVSIAALYAHAAEVFAWAQTQEQFFPYLSADNQVVVSIDGDVQPVCMTDEQRSWLVIKLNVELRDRRLYQSHADMLNTLFRLLTGRNHDVWEEMQGHYESRP